MSLQEVGQNSEVLLLDGFLIVKVLFDSLEHGLDHQYFLSVPTTLPTILHVINVSLDISLEMDNVF